MNRNPLSDLGSLGDYLREQRQTARLSVRQLSELAGVSNPYLSQIERGLKKPSAEILQQIAKGLSVSAESLYVRAGLLDPDDASDPGLPDTRAAINSDPRLTARQKDTLLSVYDSFVSGAAEEIQVAPTPERKPSASKNAATADDAPTKSATARKATTPRTTTSTRNPANPSTD